MSPDLPSGFFWLLIGAFVFGGAVSYLILYLMTRSDHEDYRL